MASPLSDMVDRKERTLNELYNVTDIIKKPEITPVLRGSCQMQGPQDETDHHILANTVVYQDKEDHIKCENIYMRAEVGASNVCSSPCSSCLHFNRALMGSNTNEFYGETCLGHSSSQYSVTDVVPLLQSSVCDNGQHANSETSNLFSFNSGNDPFSENAESKESLRTSDISHVNEDVEIIPKLSSGGAVKGDQLPLNVCGQSSHVNKFRDPRSLKGDDDNILHVNDANNLLSCNNGYADQKCMPSGSASISSSVTEGYEKIVEPDVDSPDINYNVEGSHNINNRSRCNEECAQEVLPSTILATELSSLNILSSTGMDDAKSSAKVPSTCGLAPSSQSLSCNPNVKILGEDSCSQLQCELPNEYWTKEAPSDNVCEEKSALCKCNDTKDCKVSLVAGNSEGSVMVSQNLKAGTDSDNSDRQGQALNSSKQIEEVKDKKFLVSPDVQENSIKSQFMDESDESDIVEHDIKVCDICGDAGREDLLAVCSRCSDGAEHTYCMRDMLQKVPEGDWLCEECKLEDESQKQYNVSTVDGNEKNKCSGQTSAISTDLYSKLDASETERNRTIKDISSTKISKLDVSTCETERNKMIKDIASAKVSGKRPLENIEGDSAAKRQVRESAVGSPKLSSPSRIAAFSRDCSFKDLDKRKIKPDNQSSFIPVQGHDTPETACPPSNCPRLQQPFRGILTKSNSFSCSNVKPKVKSVDEVVPQKQKSARELAPNDMKEGDARLMGKSMSFKSTNSGRLNAFESKVKMLSPKFSHGHDLKGLKQGKNWNLFERKNSFRSERPLINSAMASSTISTMKVDRKHTSRGDSYLLSSAINNHESKAVQSDNKPASPKLVSHLTLKGSEKPIILGEIKRQSSLSNGTGSSAESRPNKFGAKDDPNKFGAKDDPSSSASPILKESMLGDTPCPGELTNPTDKIGEQTLNPSRPDISVHCQKCKETGHVAQFCTVDGPHALADASATKSSRELMNGGNKLKAAIEAAMLKKPGICRKNRAFYQSDELSVSSTNLNHELALKDQLSISCNTRNAFSDEKREGQAMQGNSLADRSKQTTVANMKQFCASTASPSEVVTSRTGEASQGKSSTKALQPTSATLSFLLKMSAIPEQDYIWQGDFEVHKSGKLPKLWNGIQAHLSTCASPKVVEVVNKFPHKVLLNEIPCLSAWPMQFQERGVKEDSIGLYFFAKDTESYEKSYKSLLDSMMKSDLALKGNLGGVELLIFPSNKLPDKFQRWNALFFLWGVFRGTKENCSVNGFSSPKGLCIPRDTPAAITSLPITSLPDSSIEPIDKDLSTHERSCNVPFASKTPDSGELPRLLSEPNRDCVVEISVLEPKSRCVQASIIEQDCKLDPTSMSLLHTSSALSCPKMSFASTPSEEHVDPDCKLNRKQQFTVQVPTTCYHSDEHQQVQMFQDASLCTEPIFSDSIGSLAPGSKVVANVESKVLDRLNTDRDLMKLGKNLEEKKGSVDIKAALERPTLMQDPTTNEINIWELHHRKCPLIDASEAVSQASSPGTGEATVWNDINSMSVVGSASKKRKTDSCGLQVHNNCRDTSSLGEGFASQVHGASTSSKVKQEVCNEIAVSGNTGYGERYFFPVDRPSGKDVGLCDSPMPWKAFSSRDGDKRYDVAPNLELALGAEMKPSNQVILPFLARKVDQKNDRDWPLQNLATKGEDDDVSASLSLSLSFPFPDNEPALKPVFETQQLPPSRPYVNSSQLVFEKLLDK